MIIVKGRELLIPENERYIGTNYDTGMENRLFRIPRYSQSGTDLSDLVFKINLICDGDPLDRAEMAKEIDDNYIYLTWAVTAAQVAVTGTVFVCVTGNDTNDTVKWSSFQAAFYTEKSMGDDIDTAYHNLVNKVAKEITDRENAVSAEATARQAADTTLQQNINTEAAARAAGDAAANTRIDNIVAQSGDDITEIVDARTGADSTVYASLKARLDAENSDVKTDLNNAFSVSDYYDMEGLTITDGSYIKSDGTIASNNSYRLTDYIQLPIGVESITVNRTIYTSNHTGYPQTYMIFWYDDSKNPLAAVSQETSGNLLTSHKPTGAKYARINLASRYVEPFIKLNYYPAMRYICPKTASDTADSFTDTGFYWVGSTMDGLPTYNIGILVVNSITANIKSQMYITAYNVYTRMKSSNGWGEWNIIKNPLIIGKYDYAFTTTKTSKNTGILLKANKTYRILFASPRGGQINVYGQGNTSNAKRIYPYLLETYFTNDSTDRYLMLYNNDGIADSGLILVCDVEDSEEKALRYPTVYTVGKSVVNTYDYSSLTECLLALKDDNSPKVIEIYEGDYDIYQEYVDANVPIYSGDDPTYDYFDYCVWVPKNTHIIGKGIVRLKWMPDPNEDSITPNQCRCVSPLNTADTCTIENIEVYCKNGRYCLHNDGLGKGQFVGAVQKYINCRFYKYDNDTDTDSGLTYGFLPTTGFGIDRAMHHVYENCTFVNRASERAFYGHSRNSSVSSENQSPDITIANCVIDTNGANAVKFGNPASGVTSYEHIRVMFNNCYISGKVRCIKESGSGNCVNGFDVQYLNCGDVTMEITDPSNQYSPKAYNTNLTMV